MSHRATLQLDPVADAGLTVTAKVYDAANTLADTITCPETGTGTARYSGTSGTSLADGAYDVVFLDAAGSLRGGGSLFIALGQEVSENVNVKTVNGINAALDTGGGTGGSGTGSGDFPIDHSGGAGVFVDDVPATTDCMRFTQGGVGVDNVEVIAYTQADYLAGLRGALERRGRTYTNAQGRWVSPLMLDAGETYIVLANVRGYLAKTHKVVVP
jgi:hypothetical protein